jgi:hypothetical protein
MIAINLRISSEASGKLFRFDTTKANQLTSVSGRTGEAITDTMLAEEMPVTVQALYDGAVSYEYARSFLAAMHCRGLIRDTDLHVVVAAARPPKAGV